MTVVVDASVVLRWFVTQPGHDDAATWLAALVDDPDLLVGTDLLRFEVFGGLCRLQPPRNPEWAFRSFERFERLGIRTLPTTLDVFERAAHLSRTMRLAGYDAVYLAHAEALGARWLTADRKAIRRLGADPRVKPLAAYTRR